MRDCVFSGEAAEKKTNCTIDVAAKEKLYN